MPLVKTQHSDRPAKMDYLRGFTTRSVSESRAHEKANQSPLSQGKLSPSSAYSISRSATSSNLSSSSPQTRPPIPNTDPLPSDPGALEGLLNHHASQLKKLADRVESVNEWIEMDGIVLARLVSDGRHHVEKEDAEKAAAVGLDAGPVVMPDALSPQHYLGVSANRNRARTPVVHFREPDGRSSSEAELSTEDKVKANCNIRDIKERIKMMRRWRKELERNVYWQREEYWRIEQAMGKEKESVDLGRLPGENGWGVGGKTWEKGSGRLPTQVEWEVMFAPDRIAWDEHGPRPKQ